MFHTTTRFRPIDFKTDKEGRFVMVKGYLHGRTCTFASIYAPNTGQNVFLVSLLKSLNTFAEGEIILMGDFNLTWDADLDSTSKQRSSLGLFKDNLKQEFTQMGLTDTWRFMHPKERDFTFYSNPHRSYSRIDYTFISTKMRQHIRSSTILPTVITDHAPLELIVDWPTGTQKMKRWFFPMSLIRDRISRDNLRGAIRDFFQTNDPADTSLATTWDAFKAFLRGYCISVNTALNRQRMRERQILEKELEETEKAHKANPVRPLLRQVTALRGKLNAIYNNRAEINLLRLQRRTYDQGGKIGSMLAKQLRGKQEKEYIEKIIDEDEHEITDDQEKADTFRKFYKSLYQQEERSEAQQLEYLEGLPLTRVTTQQNEILSQKITEEELGEVIQKAKLHKAPGPDGLPAQFFKTYREELIPFLTQLFNSFGEEGSVTPSMTEAVITVIPKPGKDPTKCGSYRPIALLNLDAKLYSKILANRLENIIPDLIHPDQAGFIKDRQAGDNTRRVVHLIQKANRKRIPTVVLTLDAEKAFDRVEWSFLFATLTRYGFAPEFVEMIKANFANPTARVMANGQASRTFELGRGTRQGCPLSPLLFALSIEPLAQTIRGDDEIRGIKFGDSEHKLSLFADDILLFLTDQERSLPACMKTLKTFEEIAGFKINPSKSMILNINLPPTMVERLKEKTPFHWAKKQITYLGVQITPKVEDLHSANYPPLLATLQQDLKKWGPLYISWLGRINTIKMTILPRILYLFQTLPIPVEKSFFASLQTTILKFIWQNKRARLSAKVLRLPRESGGVALPDFAIYFQAAQLRVLAEWSARESEKHWLHMDRAIAGRTIWDLLWKPKEARPRNTYMSTPTATVLTVWDDIHRRTPLTSFPSPFTPIHYNIDFNPALQSGQFEEWRKGGCIMLSQLYQRGTIISFEACRKKFNLKKTERYHYNQLIHWASRPGMKEAATRDLTPIEKYVKGGAGPKRCISEIYKIIRNARIYPQPRHLAFWETNLERQVEEREWENLWRDIPRHNHSTHLREAHYKILYDWYYCPAKLHQIFPETSDLCWRGCGLTGDFRHIWWDCPSIRPYWQEILAQIKDILGYPIPTDMASVLLGIRSNSLKYQTIADKAVMWLCLGAAKMTIAAAWKKKDPPSLTQWHSRLWKALTMERLADIMRDSYKNFEYTWGSLVHYLSQGLPLCACPPRTRALHLFQF